MVVSATLGFMLYAFRQNETQNGRYYHVIYIFVYMYILS